MSWRIWTGRSNGAVRRKPFRPKLAGAWSGSEALEPRLALDGSIRSTAVVALATKAPRDRAGNTFKKAANLGILDPGETIPFADAVGKKDRIDYFKFQVVGQPADLRVALTGLSGNANVQLQGGNRKPVAASSRGGTASETLGQQLAPGTYYLKVWFIGKKGTTNYALAVESYVVPPPVIETPATELKEASPLDDDGGADGFALNDPPRFDLAKMASPTTRRVGDITFRFYNDKPSVTTWTTAEIDQVMAAVNELDAWTDRNRQLLIDPEYGKAHNFVKTDQARLREFLGEGNWAGLNRDQSSERIIAFIEWDESDADDTWETKQTVKHELAHNFDTSGEKSTAFNRRHPDFGLGAIEVVAFLHWQFIGQSAWLPKSGRPLRDGEIASAEAWEDLFTRPSSQLSSSGNGGWWYLSSLTTDNFTRNYGRYNPYEDWATTWELYSDIIAGREGDNWRATHSGMINKLKLVDSFFAIMGSDDSGNLFTNPELSSYFDNRYTTSTGYRGVDKP